MVAEDRTPRFGVAAGQVTPWMKQSFYEFTT